MINWAGAPEVQDTDHEISAAGLPDLQQGGAGTNEGGAQSEIQQAGSNTGVVEPTVGVCVPNKARVVHPDAFECTAGPSAALQSVGEGRRLAFGG